MLSTQPAPAPWLREILPALPRPPRVPTFANCEPRDTDPAPPPALESGIWPKEIWG